MHTPTQNNVAMLLARRERGRGLSVQRRQRVSLEIEAGRLRAVQLMRWAWRRVMAYSDLIRRQSRYNVMQREITVRVRHHRYYRRGQERVY